MDDGGAPLPNPQAVRSRDILSGVDCQTSAVLVLYYRPLCQALNGSRAYTVLRRVARSIALLFISSACSILLLGWKGAAGPQRTRVKMATKASDEETCQAVLDFVTEGNYPESGNVAASEISASALSKELELISKARDQVEVSALSFLDDTLCPY